jgi:hypothetical protein
MELFIEIWSEDGPSSISIYGHVSLENVADILASILGKSLDGAFAIRRRTDRFKDEENSPLLDELEV